VLRANTSYLCEFFNFVDGLYIEAIEKENIQCFFPYQGRLEGGIPLPPRDATCGFGGAKPSTSAKWHLTIGLQALRWILCLGRAGEGVIAKSSFPQHINIFVMHQV
jgi:hypothetical protein